MRTGDIIAINTKLIWYKPLTWLSYLIRKIAKIKYNHVGIVIEIYDTLFLFEAVEKGFIASNLKERLKSKKIDKWVLLESNYSFNKNTMILEAIFLLGTKYDFKGLLLNQLILNLFGIWIGRNNNQQDKLYCYEAVFYLHRAVFPKWWEMKPSSLFKSKYFKMTEYSN